MQTFLPYPDFRDSAEALDRQRLGKQRVEVLQILQTLAGQSRGWMNHPAVLMWRGSEATLVDYGLAVCEAWRARGYADGCADRIRALGDSPAFPRGPGLLPVWLGHPALHKSHRSNLLRKLPSWYRRLWPTEPDDLPYYWPVRARGGADARP